MSYVVKLEAFHGPLDLLLYLIEENQLDIYDIPIARITDQYLAYLQLTGNWDLDRLGDFLIMASYLLRLKSRLLLPQRPLEEEDPCAGPDPHEELTQKLLAYKNYRQIAQYLAGLEQGEIERVYYRELLPEPAEEELVADVKAVLLAYRSLRNRLKPAAEVRIPVGDIDIEAKKGHLLELLREKPGEGLAFSKLAHIAQNRRELLAYFLALLELLRWHIVGARQAMHCADIKIYLQVAVEDVEA